MKLIEPSRNDQATQYGSAKGRQPQKRSGGRGGGASPSGSERMCGATPG